MRSLVNSLVERKGIGAQVVETAVESVDQAAALQFPGSPTVRVNGRDVEELPEGKADFGLG